MKKYKIKELGLLWWVCGSIAVMAVVIGIGLLNGTVEQLGL